jgi:hypothetical protein
MSTSTPTPVPHAATSLIPDSWQEVKDVLGTERHEGHRLLLHLLDQVSAKNLTTLDLGIIQKSFEEQIDFISKLESIALFAILAERYGINFGLDEQSKAFTANADLFDLAEDLGINVQRADLPWAMDVVGMDKNLHETFDLPLEVLPLDILFTVASRCRDWYEETVGHAMAYAGRHRMVLPADLVEFLKQTLIMAYGTFAEEKEAGAEDAVAYAAVRRSLGVAA